MSIIKYPLNTEKAVKFYEEEGVYTFVVDKNANKIQIKKAIKDRWGVDVASVRTVNTLGKLKSRQTKTGIVSGRKESLKKAYVKLVEGEEPIDIYDGME